MVLVLVCDTGGITPHHQSESERCGGDEGCGLPPSPTTSIPQAAATSAVVMVLTLLLSLLLSSGC